MPLKLSTAVLGIDRLEAIALQDSPVHRLHPMAKLTATFVFAGAVISFPNDNLSGLVPYLLYPMLLMYFSDVPFAPLFHRLLAALPFGLLGGISNLFLMREPVFRIYGIVVTNGAVSFCSILLKTLLTVFAVLLLIATTSFVEINNQLIRLKIPKLICLQLVMTYRYITVLLLEASAMYTAYKLRSPGKKGIRFADVGSFIGELLIKSFDRAERVYAAMKCRGFRGVYVGGVVKRAMVKDVLFGIIVCLAAILLRVFNLSVFLGGFIG